MSYDYALFLIAFTAAGGLFAWQQQRLRRLRARVEASAVELQRLQQSCALLAPAGVVERLFSDGPESIAEHKVFTAMFTDLVGYTALAERLDPKTLAGVLNGYFQLVSDAVAEHRGRVGTFLGDGILIFFGALEPNPWQCDDAAYAALAIRAGLGHYNTELERAGLPRIAIGVGIHRGPGLAGLIGSRDRREYTVVGPTLNLAARVQALTREHRHDILLTETVREQLDPGFALMPMPAVAVKGIDEPVVTYAVLEGRAGR
ncbi:MAG TPA: adenylate/guanylate cyclase domain-containing protein [Burkholderiales bacterium]|nr:adenylate/guanylate cyclase domain-containing protein [Burkholderiales bacterium]